MRLPIKQKASVKLGALLVTYGGIMSWVGVYSISILLLVGWKSYQDIITSYLPWFNLIWLFVFAAIPIGIIAGLEMLVFQPSRISYANEQGYKHDSPVRDDLQLVLENQKKIMDKLEIE